MNKILLILLLSSILSSSLYAQSDRSKSSKFEFDLDMGIGVNIIQSDESLNLHSTSVFSGRDNNIGFSNPGFIAQLGVEARRNIIHGFYWGGSVSVAYTYVNIDRIVQWTHEGSGFLDAYDVQTHLTLKAQGVNGLVPLYFGKYLNKRKTLALELGILNQIRIIDNSKFVIIETKIKDFSGISTSFPIVPGIITSFKEEKSEIKDENYQWGLLSKVRFQCFRLNDKPFFLAATYLYYPKNKDFVLGHRLNGRLLLSISTSF